MTDITNFDSQVPNFDEENYRGFSDFEMKSVVRNKRSEDTEKQLAEILQDLENIGSGWVGGNNFNEKDDKWGVLGGNSNDASMSNFIYDYDAKGAKTKSVLKKVVGGISACFVALQSISFANWFTFSSANTLFGIFSSVDSMFRASGIALAIGCGSFPFVAYALQIGAQNGDGITTEDSAIKSTFKPDPRWYKKQLFEPIDRVDPNGTPDYNSKIPIMSNGRGLPHADIMSRGESELIPTAPKAKPYAVKDVVDELAMIEYDRGYWFEKPGSTLPDGSRYVRVLKNTQSGKLELITSKGIVPVKGAKYSIK